MSDYPTTEEIAEVLDRLDRSPSSRADTWEETRAVIEAAASLRCVWGTSQHDNCPCSACQLGMVLRSFQRRALMVLP